MILGIIVATKEEGRSFDLHFRRLIVQQEAIHHSYTVYRYRAQEISPDLEIVLIESGVGEINAAAATQYLIDTFHVEKIINYGIAGGINDFSSGIGIVNRIIHYDYDISTDPYQRSPGKYKDQKDIYLRPEVDLLADKHTPTVRKFTCVSGDKFITPGEAKFKMYKKFGADVCEMEAAAIVRVCNRNHIPCGFVKGISDGVEEGIHELEMNAKNISNRCVHLIYHYLPIILGA